MNNHFLVPKDKAPIFTVEPNILTGYRKKLSIKECIYSMFYWHNQTVNIWTSIMLILFNLWLAYYFTNITIKMSPIFQLFFWIQGISRSYCWFNSWAYHTFSCNSKSTSHYWCTMDYIGCYLTPLGMGTNIIYIELYCHFYYQVLIILFGFIIIIAAITLSALPIYQSEEYRKIRLIFSIFSTLPYLIGIIIAIIIVHEVKVPTYYAYFLYAIIIELFAGFFYVSTFPEIIFPKYFDILMPSHSIWHWLNFGFDAFMMLLSYSAFIELENSEKCI